MKFTNKESVLCLLASLLLLAACGQEKPVAIPSIAEFLHNDVLLKDTMATCRPLSHEAQRANPLCVAAIDASARKNTMPCFSKGIVDHACIDKRGYTR
jgi:hypothetical protein